MFKLHSYLINLSVAACIMTGLIACSDNDVTLPQLSEKVYSGNSELDLEYCGQPMSGKYVKFSPNGEMATLEMGGALDLSAIPGAGLSGTIPVPGVLPGTYQLTLQTSLIPDDDEYSFSGKDENDFVTFSYEGDVTDKKMEFDFTAVKLKNTTLCGESGTVWKPAPIVAGSELFSWTSSPFHTVWEVEPIPELSNLEIPLSNLIQMILNTPFIPVYHNTAYSSFAQLYYQAVQTIAFLPNGNIPVRYFSSSNGATQLRTSTPSMLQYVVLNGGNASNFMTNLYINPIDAFAMYLTNKGNGYTGTDDITWTTKGESPSESELLDKVILNLISTLAPKLAQGIPQQCVMTSESLTMFANTELSKTIVEKVILPLLQDPTTKQLILKAIQNDPSLASHAQEISDAIELFPTIAQHTTRFELGFNFIPYK